MTTGVKAEKSSLTDAPARPEQKRRATRDLEPLCTRRFLAPALGAKGVRVGSKAARVAPDRLDGHDDERAGLDDETAPDDVRRVLLRDGNAVGEGGDAGAGVDWASESAERWVRRRGARTHWRP